MYRFIESICCIDGVLQNLDYHQKRINKTFKKYSTQDPFTLKPWVSGIPGKGKYKYRIIYDNNIIETGFEPYQNRDLKKIKIVECDDINYDYKFNNRNTLDRLFLKRGLCDDIIIIKNDKVTDAYYSNLAFFDGSKWYTPESPLLKGTKRAKYLDEGILTALPMSKPDIFKFKKISLINAMLDLGDEEVEINECVM